MNITFTTERWWWFLMNLVIIALFSLPLNNHPSGCFLFGKQKLWTSFFLSIQCCLKKLPVFLKSVIAKLSLFRKVMVANLTKFHLCKTKNKSQRKLHTYIDPFPATTLAASYLKRAACRLLVKIGDLKSSLGKKTQGDVAAEPIRFFDENVEAAVFSPLKIQGL